MGCVLHNSFVFGKLQMFLEVPSKKGSILYVTEQKGKVMERLQKTLTVAFADTPWL